MFRFLTDKSNATILCGRVFFRSVTTDGGERRALPRLFLCRFVSHLTSPHLTSPHLISPHLTFPSLPFSLPLSLLLSPLFSSPSPSLPCSSLPRPPSDSLHSPPPVFLPPLHASFVWSLLFSVPLRRSRSFSVRFTSLLFSSPYTSLSSSFYPALSVFPLSTPLFQFAHPSFFLLRMPHPTLLFPSLHFPCRSLLCFTFCVASFLSLYHSVPPFPLSPCLCYPLFRSAVHALFRFALLLLYFLLRIHHLLRAASLPFHFTLILLSHSIPSRLPMFPFRHFRSPHPIPSRVPFPLVHAPLFSLRRTSRLFSFLFLSAYTVNYYFVRVAGKVDGVV